MNLSNDITVKVTGFDELSSKIKKLRKTVKKTEKIMSEINAIKIRSVNPSGAKTIAATVKITFNDSVKETADIESVAEAVGKDITNELLRPTRQDEHFFHKKI